MAQPNDSGHDYRTSMLRLNLEQRKFYESTTDHRGNVLTKKWRQVRHRSQRIRRDLRISEFIEQRHMDWLGDLEGKRVLDLGCYDGNTLSLDIAKRSGYYLGLDLSEPAIRELQRKLREEGIAHAHAEAGDFLALDFPHEPFDVIYGYSVMHHFRHFNTFLEVLHQRLVPGGKVITIDPLQTALTSRVARALYRPFQSDAEWEWPFTRKSFSQVEKYFHIDAIQGVFGYSKWTVPLSMLPFGTVPARMLAPVLHKRDIQEATRQGPGLWRCLQVALALSRRNVVG